MKTFLGFVLGFFGLLGMCLSVVGLRLWWLFGIIAVIVKGVAGVGILGCIGWLLGVSTLSILVGLLGLLLSSLVTYLSIEMLES